MKKEFILRNDWIPVTPPVADHVFNSIMDKCSMIMGEFGAYNPDLPMALNSLHYIVPGQGFWIKVTEPVGLKYPQ